jgi:ribosome-binding factor A
MPNRINKINELIKKNIGEIILKDINLKPGLFITVTKVDTTKDLRYTRVFVSIFPEKDIDYAIKTLEGELYNIQGFLNRQLSLKPLPRIEFKIDKTESEAQKIETLIKEIRS